MSKKKKRIFEDMFDLFVSKRGDSSNKEVVRRAGVVLKQLFDSAGSFKAVSERRRGQQENKLLELWRK